MKTLLTCVCILLPVTVLAQQRSVADNAPDRIYWEYQVQKPARQTARSRKPAYPSALKALGIEAEVQAEFIVDTLGVPDTASFRIVKSPDARFTSAVREALPSLSYVAAELNGRRVRQRVTQRFLFAPPH